MASYLERLKAKEDNLLALGIATFVGVPFFTFLGFLIGTVAGSKHVIDLQVEDMQHGVVGAGAGFLVGVIVMFLVATVYPRITAADDPTVGNR